MPFEIEHILPQSVGGRTEEANLCLACPRCNRYKGKQFEGLDTESGNVVTLYNPRQQDWFEHFSWSPDGLRIVGLTSVGRTTITVLQMNNPFVIRSRHVWVASGWHPTKTGR